MKIFKYYLIDKINLSPNFIFILKFFLLLFKINTFLRFSKFVGNDLSLLRFNFSTPPTSNFPKFSCNFLVMF